MIHDQIGFYENNLFSIHNRTRRCIWVTIPELQKFIRYQVTVSTRQSLSLLTVCQVLDMKVVVVVRPDILSHFFDGINYE